MTAGDKIELISALKAEFAKRKSGFGKFLLGPDAKVFREFILTETEFLDLMYHGESISLTVRCWFLFNNMREMPACQNPACGNPISISQFLNLNTGFRKYCCRKCAYADSALVEHRRQTCIDKYGVDSTSKIPEKIDQMLKTRRERYGESYSSVVEKARQTRFKRNNGQWHSDGFGEKCKQTKFERHGDRNWTNQPQREKTVMEKYAVKSVLCLPSVREKTNNRILGKAYARMLADEFDEPVFTLSDFFEKHGPVELGFRCRKCGRVFKAVHKNGFHSRCPDCYPKTDGVSAEEAEIRDFVKTLPGASDAVFNSRSIISPHEIDIYVPSRNLAIEFDGLYWHSTAQGKGRLYHLGKTDACAEKGIRLVHIFENEWFSKREIVKSRLRDMFGVYDKVVYARSCEVEETSGQEVADFDDDNHIQGHVNASAAFSLKLGCETVAVMTFGKSRFSRKYEWEMLRFCCKKGYHVPGAAGRLLAAFERKYRPSSLVTYADRRWSQGGLYRALGFALDRISPPNYWYVDGKGSFLSRMSCQKSKLRSMLVNFNPALSEVENMRQNGFFQIFDCGNLVFSKTYKAAAVSSDNKINL